jgi:hypothetical protein
MPFSSIRFTIIYLVGGWRKKSRLQNKISAQLMWAYSKNHLLDDRLDKIIVKLSPYLYLILKCTSSMFIGNPYFLRFCKKTFSQCYLPSNAQAI